MIPFLPCLRGAFVDLACLPSPAPSPPLASSSRPVDPSIEEDHTSCPAHHRTVVVGGGPFRAPSRPSEVGDALAVAGDAADDAPRGAAREEVVGLGWRRAGCLEHEEQRRARRDGLRNAEHSRCKDRGLARGLVDSQTCMDSATTAHRQLGAEILLPAGSLRCVSRKLAECVSLVCLWSNATVRVSSAVYNSSVKTLSEYPSNAFDGEG